MKKVLWSWSSDSALIGENYLHHFNSRTKSVKTLNSKENNTGRSFLGERHETSLCNQSASYTIFRVISLDILENTAILFAHQATDEKVNSALMFVE